MMPSDFTRPALTCVHFTYDELRAPDAIRVASIDGRSIHSAHALLRALADSCGFPSYFGDNWDAFDECIQDPSEWDPDDSGATPAGVVVVVEYAEALWAQAPQAAGQLIECWLGAAADFIESGWPAHLVFRWAPPAADAPATP